MVNLKMESRSIGDEPQYLREGFFKQFETMVVLKSEGGCKFARSSMTVAGSAGSK